jgi:hypothetical protein
MAYEQRVREPTSKIYSNPTAIRPVNSVGVGTTPLNTLPIGGNVGDSECTKQTVAMSS